MMQKLIDAITGTTVYAGTDYITPILCAVKIAGGPDGITLVATDRFSAARARIAQPSDEFVAVVDVKELKAVVSWAKMRSAETFSLSVTDGGMMRIETAGGSMEVPTVTNRGTYPEVETIFDNAKDEKNRSEEDFSMNVKYLAKLAKLPTGMNTPVWRFRPSGKKALLVTPSGTENGVEWEALHMPVKVAPSAG